MDHSYRPAALVFRSAGGSPWAACVPFGDTKSHHVRNHADQGHAATGGRERDRVAGYEHRRRAKVTSGLVLCQSAQHWGWNRGRVWAATDGSATTFISDADVKDWTLAPSLNQIQKATGTLYMRNGTQYRFLEGNVVWIRDRNGNMATFSNPDPNGSFTITDALGRTTTVTKHQPWEGQSQWGGEYDEIAFKGAGGQDRSIKVFRRIYWPDVYDPVACPPSGDCGSQPEYSLLFPGYGGALPVSELAVSSILLPDGRDYQFKYSKYGEVSRVVLPTGGAYEFDWANGQGTGPVVQPAGPALVAVYRRATERREYPNGGTTGSWARRTAYSVTEYQNNGALGDPLQGEFPLSPYRCAGNYCTEVTATEVGATGTLSVEKTTSTGPRRCGCFRSPASTRPGRKAGNSGRSARIAAVGHCGRWSAFFSNALLPRGGRGRRRRGRSRRWTRG